VSVLGHTALCACIPCQREDAARTATAMMRMQLDEMTQERDALQGRLDRHTADANKPLRVAPTHGIEHREIAALRASLAASQAEAGALRGALRLVMPWAERPVSMHRLKSVPQVAINEQTDEVEMWSTHEHDPECPQCPREAERAAACEQARAALAREPGEGDK
jgi:hypothetical protein